MCTATTQSRPLEVETNDDAVQTKPSVILPILCCSVKGVLTAQSLSGCQFVTFKAGKRHTIYIRSHNCNVLQVWQILSVPFRFLKIFMKYILKISLALFQVKRRSISPDMYTKLFDSISVPLRFIRCPRTYTYMIYYHHVMHFNILLLKA